jgi:hypothetical protein
MTIDIFATLLDLLHDNLYDLSEPLNLLFNSPTHAGTDEAY